MPTNVIDQIDRFVSSQIEATGVSREHGLGEGSEAIKVAERFLRALGFSLTGDLAYIPASSFSYAPMIWASENKLFCFVDNDGSVVEFFADDFRNYWKCEDEAADIERLARLGYPRKIRKPVSFRAADGF